MTNGDKFLKDGVSAREFIEALEKYGADTNEIKTFLIEQARPTLTEDERVILKNLRYEKGAYEYTKIGRTELDSEGRCDLILIDSDNESVWWGEYGHLFQFIKERRRILY